MYVLSQYVRMMGVHNSYCCMFLAQNIHNSAGNWCDNEPVSYQNAGRLSQINRCWRISVEIYLYWMHLNCNRCPHPMSRTDYIDRVSKALTTEPLPHQVAVDFVPLCCGLVFFSLRLFHINFSISQFLFSNPSTL